MNAKSQAVILAGEPTHAVATAPSFSFQDMHRMAVALQDFQRAIATFHLIDSQITIPALLRRQV